MRKNGPPAAAIVIPPGQDMDWDAVFPGGGTVPLTERLREFRWFAGKARTLAGVRVEDLIPLGHGRPGCCLAILEVTYRDAEPDRYLLPLAFAAGEETRRVEEASPGSILFRVEREGGGDIGLIHDAVGDPRFGSALLESLVQNKTFRGTSVEVSASGGAELRRLVGSMETIPSTRLVRAEQSNSSISYGDSSHGDSFILKLFRRIEPGTNPELELGRFLGARKFPHTPPLLGSIEGRRGGSAFSIAVLHGFVPNAGDGWTCSLEALEQLFRRALNCGDEPGTPARPLLESLTEEPPARIREVLGSFPEMASLLGKRTAELHVALGSDTGDPVFSPEPFTPPVRDSLHRTLRGLASQVCQLLRRKAGDFHGEARREVDAVLEREEDLLRSFRGILETSLASLRIRCHGDYHLGQVLFTGQDFIIIDFEGEPARTLVERRGKMSPLRDVAGMLRSFHYAARTALEERFAKGEEQARLEPWALLAVREASAGFLRSYLEGVRGRAVFAWSPEELRLLLEFHLIEKAIYEIGYELQNRPGWVRIPLQGLLELLRGV